MKDLAKAMGRKWCDHKWVKRCDSTYFCSQPGCWYSENSAAFYETELPRNPSPTDEAFCWKALQYMMGREDWARFYSAADFKYTTSFEWGIGEHCFMQWLLSNPARFIGLCDGWCREHEEVKA